MNQDTLPPLPPEGVLICTLQRNWWAFVLRGALSLMIAVLVFVMPADSLVALTIVFGAFSFVDGAFELVSAIRRIRKQERWGWLAFSGMLGILTGIVVVVSPLIATLVLATFLWVSIAFWSMLSGVFEMVAAIRLRNEIKGEIWLFISGLLSVALSVLVIWLLFMRPVESFLALGWLLGLYAAILGMVLILLGLKLRKTPGASRSATPGRTDAAPV